MSGLRFSMVALLATSSLSAFSISSYSYAQGAVDLDPIVITGEGEANCVSLAQDRFEGDQRPLCVGDGVIRENLSGASLTREDFERTPIGPRVDSIVRNLPGIATGGGPDEDKDARVLGLDKEYTRTTIDGIQLPDGGEKREFNLDRLGSALVGEVEVVRSRRAEMEADGIAGRVNVRLRRIPEVFTGEVSGAFGADFEQNQSQNWFSANMGGMINQNIGAQGALSYARQALSKSKEKYAANGVLRETEEETKPTVTRDLMLDLLWQNENTAITVRPLFLDLVENKTKEKLKYNPLGVFNGRDYEEEEKTKETLGGSIALRHDLDTIAGARIDARFAYFAGRETKDKFKKAFNAAGVENLNAFETEVERKKDAITQGELSFTIPFSAFGIENYLKIGGLLRDKNRTKSKLKFDRFGAPKGLNVKDVYELREFVYAGFVQNEMRITERFHVTPGIRFEGSRLRSVDLANNARSGRTLDFLPSLPVHWKVTDNLSFDAGVAAVLNRPKFDLLIPYSEERGDRFALGNPDLKSEQGWAFDADITYKSRYLTLGFGVFHREISGIIEEVNTGAFIGAKPVFRFENVGDGWTNGIITSQRISLGFLDIPVLSGFTVSSNQTFARSQLTEKVTGITRPFKEQPSFFGNLNAEWSDPQNRFLVAASVNYTAERKQDNEVQDAELSLDVQLRYKIHEQFELFALGQNLTSTQRVKRKSNGDRDVEKTTPAFFFGATARF